jgi:hypothetical protein
VLLLNKKERNIADIQAKEEKEWEKVDKRGRDMVV